MKTILGYVAVYNDGFIGNPSYKISSMYKDEKDAQAIKERYNEDKTERDYKWIVLPVYEGVPIANSYHFHVTKFRETL